MHTLICSFILHFTVHALTMLLKSTLIIVGLLTHTARERTLSTMQPVLMFLQITLTTE